VLQFLYTGDYTLDFQTDRDEEKEINLEQSSEEPSQDGLSPSEYRRAFTACQFHVQMYAQADYFQIDGLKSRAEKYFRGSFLDQLNRESFEAVIKEIYTSTPESDDQIRDVAVALTMDNLEILRNGTEVILLDRFLKQLPAFAADISISLLKNHGVSQKQVIPTYSAFGRHSMLRRS
jgi:hypothetical protein